MPQRTDKILHDIISEGAGGSAYYHFNLSVTNPITQTINAVTFRASWIAPRPVRIINNRAVSVDLVDTAGTGVASTFNLDKRDTVAAATRTVIATVDPGTFTALILNTPTLVTTVTGGIPHVVAQQYDYFFVTLVGAANEADEIFDFSYMAHYSFEDL